MRACVRMCGMRMRVCGYACINYNLQTNTVYVSNLFVSVLLSVSSLAVVAKTLIVCFVM